MNIHELLNEENIDRVVLSPDGTSTIYLRHKTVVIGEPKSDLTGTIQGETVTYLPETKEVLFRNRTYSLADWSNVLGGTRCLIHKRIANSGWKWSKALTTASIKLDGTYNDITLPPT